MGVQGLMSFVENNRHALYRREQFCESNLVIDGFGLLYALYFDEGRDGSLHGEFLDFYWYVEKFFLTLKECNISPFVIFDGPIEENKLPCVIKRLNERVKDVQKFVTGKLASGGRLLPMFAADAMQHYLISNRIPVAIALVDGDDETVAVANHLKCPVLSKDSDYYIYNVRGGYLPLNHFQWKQQPRVDRRSGRKGIFCEKYHVSAMCNLFKVPLPLLPFLSVLLGNDWIHQFTFRELVSSFPLRQDHHGKVKKQKPTDQKILSVFNWLAAKKGNDGAVFDTLFAHLRRTQQGKLMRIVEDCVALYREPTNIPQTLKALGIGQRRGNDFKRVPHQVIQDIVRECRVHSSVINLLESQYVCLYVIMSDPQKSSPYDVASDIRHLTYRVLLWLYRYPMTGPELLRLQEYDKVQTRFAKLPPVSVLTSQCVMCEGRHSPEQHCVGNRQKLFSHFTTMEILRKILPKISSFCDFANNSYALDIPQDLKAYLDLVMTSTLLWIHKTSPDSHKKCALLAILACSFSVSCKSIYDETRGGQCQSNHGQCLRGRGQYQSSYSQRQSWRGQYQLGRSQCQSGRGQCQSWRGQYQLGRGRCQSEHGQYQSRGCSYQSKRDSYLVMVEQFLGLLSPRVLTCESRRNEDIGPVLDVGLLHSVAQWLCTLHATVLLHQVVENPSTKFSIHHFFTSGSLLHEIHFRLKQFPTDSTKSGISSLSKAIADRLDPMPDIKAAFEVFVAFVSS